MSQKHAKGRNGERLSIYLMYHVFFKFDKSNAVSALSSPELGVSTASGLERFLKNIMIISKITIIIKIVPMIIPQLSDESPA